MINNCGYGNVISTMSFQPRVKTFAVSDDPNEPDEEISLTRLLSKSEPQYERNDLHKLSVLLENDSKKYKRCRFKKTGISTGIAVVIDEEKQIPLNTRKNLGRAFNGDIVVVEVHTSSPGNNESSFPVQYIGGKVIGIWERKEDLYEKRFICRIDDMMRMVPIDKTPIKFHLQSPFYKFKSKKIHIYKRRDGSKGEFELRQKRFEIVNPYSNYSQIAKLFTVRYISWSRFSPFPKGYVEGTYSAEDISVINVRFQVPGNHEKKVNKEAEKLVSSYEQKHYADLSDLFVFTIDNADTKIYDDGLSIERCSEHGDGTDICWKVGIHIANVGSVVPIDTSVGIAAEDRGISFDGTNGGKMLPEILHQKCSLTEGNECFAVSYFFHSTRPPTNIYSTSSEDCNGQGAISTLPSEDEASIISSSDDDSLDTEPSSCTYVPLLTKIRPRRNLTYSKAQEYLDRRRSTPFLAGNDGNLPQQIYHLWTVMWHHRVLRLGEAVFYREPLNSERKEVQMARMLVEEAMITVNAFTGKFMKDLGKGFMAKVQGLPAPRGIEEWRPSELSLYQRSCSDFFTERRNLMAVENDAHESNTMVISSKVWEDIEAALNEDKVEAAVLLACCDDHQPEMSVSLKELHEILPRAEFTESGKDTFHCCLRVEAYARCSSPIRKYYDLWNQRLLIDLLPERNQPSPMDLKKFLETRTPNMLQDDATNFLEKEVHERIAAREEAALEYEKHLSHFHFCRDFAKSLYEGFVVEIDELRLLINFPNMCDAHITRPRDIITSQMSKTIHVIRISEITPSDVDVEKKCLKWLFRYYDLLDRRRLDLPNLFGGKVIETKLWKEFLKTLKEDKFLKRNREALKRILERLVKNMTFKPNNEETRRKKNKKLTTPNGATHGCEVVRSIQSLPLFFQFSKAIEDGIPVIMPQLLYLTEKLDVCLAHRRHVTLFNIDHLEDTITFSHTGGIKYYYERWLPLVRMDGLYASVQGNNSVLLSVKISLQGMNGHFAVNTDYANNVFLFIQKGDYVCLRQRQYNKGKLSNLTTWNAHGYITNVYQERTNTNIEFTLSPQFDMSPFDASAAPMICEVIPQDISHRRMAAALRFVVGEHAPPFIQQICLGKIDSVLVDRPFNQEAIRAIIDSVGIAPVEGFQVQLNQVQTNQVKKALRERVTLIQGPPGTGKSLMGAHLAYYYIKINKVSVGRGKVLYCGPSNKSVDVVAEYLMKFHSLKVRRVYGNAVEEIDYPIPNKPKFHDIQDKSPNENLRSVALHHVIREAGKPKANELREYDESFRTHPEVVSYEMYAKYYSVLKKAKQEELKDVDVVLCTCIGAGGGIVSELNYAQCIIDECGMCSEPECLVPLAAAAKNAGQNLQVTLIGDHKQLEPIILCPQAAYGGMKISMFERLEKHAEKLTVQYRMDKMICEFPSKRFYDNELTTDKSVDQRRIKVISCFKPINFYDVVGEEQENVTKSKFNVKEAEKVVSLAKTMIKEKILPKDIMILSPYLAQCRLLQTIIKKDRLLNSKKIHVGTVVTSQGSEADYVIISTVRSHDNLPMAEEMDIPWLHKYIGFAADDHQINVAITRAKLALLIVGNRDLLYKYHTWKDLIRHSQVNHAITYPR